MRDIKNECYSCLYMEKLPCTDNIKCLNPDFNMTGVSKDTEKGWFIYPNRFAPECKEKECNNYKER